MQETRVATEGQATISPNTARLLAFRDKVSALSYAVSKEASRYAMNRILLNPKGYWATDGRIGVHIPLEEGEEVSGEILLPEFPNKKALPNDCHLSWGEEPTCKLNILSEKEGVAISLGVVQESFPDMASLIEGTRKREIQAKVLFDLLYLEKLVKTLKPIAKTFTTRGAPIRISLAITSELNPMLFELKDGKGSALLMPMQELGK